MKRPFLQFAIQKIESLFQKSKDNPTLLRQIKNELEHRKSKRSKTLKNKIDAKIVITDFDNFDKEKAAAEAKVLEEKRIADEKAAAEVVAKEKAEAERGAAQVKAAAEAKALEEKRIADEKSKAEATAERVAKEKLKSRKQVKAGLYEDEIDSTLGSTAKIGIPAKSDIKLEDLLKSITLRDFVENDTVPVRLRNAIVREIDFIKFHTIYDFIISTDYEKKSLLQLPNFGRKSLDDLMFSVESFIKEQININGLDQPIQDLVQQEAISTKNALSINVNEALKDSLNINQVEALKNISLGFFVNNANEISFRTRNVILSAEKHKLLIYSNLHEFYISTLAHRQKLLNLENFGKGSLENLTQCIDNIVNDEEQLVLMSDKSVRSNDISVFSSIKELINYAVSMLNENYEQEIVQMRHLQKDRLTLKELGDRIGVTRERIRQIDSKAVEKVGEFLSRFSQEDLDLNFRSEINNYLFIDNSFVSKDSAKQALEQIPGAAKLFINSISGNLPEFLNNWYFYSSDFEGWFIKEEYLKASTVDNDNLYIISPESNINLQQAIKKSEWPITLTSLVSSMHLPECVIKDKILLSKDFSLRKVGNKFFIELRKIHRKDAVRYVLRRYKREMKVKEVRENCLEMFGLKLTQAAVCNILISLPDGLIVGTGTYALYEYLDFNKKQLINIRKFCNKYLLEKQKYISAFVVFNDLKKQKQKHIHETYGSALKNGHILYGICQDDDKFLTKKGFMLGVNSTDFKGVYVSLTQEIIDLMKKHNNRALTIDEIIDGLSLTRSLIWSAVFGMLDQNKHKIFEKRGNVFCLANDDRHLVIDDNDIYEDEFDDI
jgi:hypothetical protein